MAIKQPYTSANDPSRNRDNEYNGPYGTEGNPNPALGTDGRPLPQTPSTSAKKAPGAPGSLPAKDAVAEGQRLSWTPASNARNYVVTRNGQVVNTTQDGNINSYRDPQSNKDAKYEVSYTDENGNKQIVKHTSASLKPKVNALRPNEKGYVAPLGLPTFSLIKDRGEFYLCVSKNGKSAYEGPDSLEGMLKTISAKLTYFAELASLPPIVPLSVPNHYSPTDETQVNRLIGMAKRAGEFHEEAPFGTYKTRQDPQVRGFIPEPDSQRKLPTDGKVPVVASSGKAAVVK